MARVLARPGQLPLVRTSLLSVGGVVVIGLVGAALVVRHVRLVRTRRLQSRAGYGLSPQQRPELPQGVPGKRPPERAQLPIQAGSAAEPAAEAAPAPPLRDGQELLLDEELPLSPKALWKLIYDRAFVQHFKDRMGNRECEIGKWVNKDGQLVRKVTYVKPLKKNALGPREAFTEERCACLHRGDAGFQVEVQAFTPKVPYGSSFHVSLLWTAARVAGGRTRLQVAGGVVFTKRPVVAGIIRKAAMEGLRETYAAYREHLLAGVASLPQEVASGSLQKQAPAKARATGQQHATAVSSRDASQTQQQQKVGEGGGRWLPLVRKLLGLLLLCLGLLLLPPQLQRGGRALAFDRYLEGLRML